MRTTKKSRFAWAVTAVLFIAACAYIGAGLFGELAPGLRTAPVGSVTVTESLTLRGLALRSERLIGLDGGEILAENARRVPAGGLVARTEEEAVTLSDSALFFTDWDGLERLGPDCLENLTVSGLRQLLEEEPSTEANVLGRLVFGYDWYFAALIKEDAALSAPSGYRLLFEGMDRPAQAELIFLSPPEGDRRAALFRLKESGESWLSLRMTAATLLLSEISGLEVPEEAVRRNADGSEFVYTVTAGVIERKAVEILYRGEGRCVAARDRGADALREGNTVVVSPGELQEGSVAA